MSDPRDEADDLVAEDIARRAAFLAGDDEAFYCADCGGVEVKCEDDLCVPCQVAEARGIFL